MGILLVRAGFVLVGKAIGVEMPSAVQATAFGEEEFAYAMIITCEESMGMLGVVILIYALADYINWNGWWNSSADLTRARRKARGKTCLTRGAGNRDNRQALPAST